MDSFPRPIIFLHGDPSVRKKIEQNAVDQGELDGRFATASSFNEAMKFLHGRPNAVLVYPNRMPLENTGAIRHQLIAGVKVSSPSVMLLNYDATVDMDDGGHGHIKVSDANHAELLDMLSKITGMTTVEILKSEVPWVK